LNLHMYSFNHSSAFQVVIMMMMMSCALMCE
jgi:hypothetical protein